MLAHAIDNETGVPFHQISAAEVVSGASGASEEIKHDLFPKAYKTSPSVLFIDQIDAIASKRENLQRKMEQRIVSQLMTCMDEISNRMSSFVLVIGATRRLDLIDQALRRPGRLDTEIDSGFPDENARE